MKQIFIREIGTTYYITQDGKCYNSITGKYLKGQENPKNHYISYNLTLPSGKKKRCYAHRLVALAFIPNPDNKTEVNHIDGNKLNNCVGNLEWATPAENKQYAIEKGLKATKKIYCFSKDKKLVAIYKNMREASSAVGLSVGAIQQEVTKKPKTLSGDFYWSYSSELGETKDYKNLGKPKPVNQYTREGKYLMTYPSVGAAARALGKYGSSHIGECCRGKIKSYKNFVWRYVEDIVSPLDESQSAPQAQKGKCYHSGQEVRQTRGSVTKNSKNIEK